MSAVHRRIAAKRDARRTTPVAEVDELPPTEQVARFFPKGAVWCQLPDEPDDSFVKFVWFLLQGPTRTLAKAKDTWVERYGSKHRDGGLPSGWEYIAMQYKWRERATKYDVYTITMLVPETAGIIFEALKLYALRVHEALSNPKMAPKTFTQATLGIETLTSFLSPETIAAATAVHASTPGDETSSTEGEASSVDSGYTPDALEEETSSSLS